MFKIKNHPKGDYESPVNMPYGVSYLLPIIVSCLVRQIPKDRLFENYNQEDEENELVIIENPEAHLHPFAQSKLGYFLAKMSKHVQIIIETHSEHIINGIRLATLEEDIDQNEIINFLESNEDSIQPNIKEISIDQFSDLTDWPRGFFDQQEADISKIFKHKRELRNAH
jgi:predicted ATPase